MSHRILHLVPATPFGGIQRFVASLAAEQIRQGVDVVVVVVYDDLKLTDLLTRMKIPFKKVGGVKPSLSAAIMLRRILHNYSPHVVHLHASLLWINAFGLLCKNVPWIYHAHSYSRACATIKSRLVEHLLRRVCDARIAVSKSVGEKQNIGPSMCPTFVVHNGIEVGQELIKPKTTRDTSCIFGFASRITKDKGLSAFMKVASDIIRLQPDARFLIAGDGGDILEFTTELESVGIFKNVKMLGHVENMTSFWSAIDVFMFVAPHDTFGLTIVEAMARHVPVVAYRTGTGSDEILVHNENALVADYGDSQQFARYALSFISQPALQKRITANAIATTNENFSIAKCAERIGKVYSSVCPAFVSTI